MIANGAFLAAMVLLLVVFVVVGEVEFLAPYRAHLLARLWVLVGALVVLFINLFALFYWTARSLFLKDTGRKLAHVERLLETEDTIVRDLSARLAVEE